jgi:hypothetical protein
MRAPPGQALLGVLAVTECLVWVPVVTWFTVTVESVAPVWPHQRLDGPFAGLMEKDHEHF